MYLYYMTREWGEYFAVCSHLLLLMASCTWCKQGISSICIYWLVHMTSQYCEFTFVVFNPEQLSCHTMLSYAKKWTWVPQETLHAEMKFHTTAADWPAYIVLTAFVQIQRIWLASRECGSLATWPKRPSLQYDVELCRLKRSHASWCIHQHSCARPRILVTGSTAWTFVV